MKKSSGLWAALLVPAFMLIAASISPAWAQDKPAPAPMIKEIGTNDKLHVYEVTYKPGDASPSRSRSMRVVHAMSSGMLERTSADGKKETVQWKAGETKLFSETQTYAVKNIGKTTARLLVIEAK